MNGAFDKSKLEEIGFQGIGQWALSGEQLIFKLARPGSESDAICDFPNSLYAFTCQERILYIGKTTQSIRVRFRGYCRPEPTQSTNKKCHREILGLLKKNSPVNVSVFVGNRFLRYDIFEINLAAGLEDSLIETLRPLWNGKLVPGEMITETKEIEKEAAAPVLEFPPAISPPERLDGTSRFEIKLGKTYYGRGFVNIPTLVSDRIGKHGEPMLIRLGEMNHPGVESRIDWKANQSGTPRIYGGARVVQWFGENFALGETLHGVVLSPHQILFVKSRTS
jgi:hypothetical protein